MLLKRLRLAGMLSFKSVTDAFESEPIELGPLNVLIGPNGSGKSNFIECISLLQSLLRKNGIAKAIGRSGGIGEWLWKGEGRGNDTWIEAVVQCPKAASPLQYALSFSEEGQRTKITEERIEDENVDGREPETRYYTYRGGSPTLFSHGTTKSIPPDSFRSEDSILAQRNDPENYPEITALASAFEQIRIYRDWSFGRNAPPRHPQQTDMPNDFLAEDNSNLGLVLNTFLKVPTARANLLENLKNLYSEIDDFFTITEAGTVQTFFREENNFTIPAIRLSDGTLRYLCLLAILCHPNPPPLVCIEEPELGLHPDVLPGLADLLVEASERMQLIVTTHSDILVDALTAIPEAVLVCEKHEGRTTLRRLNPEKMKPWLEKFRLGELWTSGELGGVRW